MYGLPQRSCDVYNVCDLYLYSLHRGVTCRVGAHLIQLSLPQRLAYHPASSTPSNLQRPASRSKSQYQHGVQHPDLLSMFCARCFAASTSCGESCNLSNIQRSLQLPVQRAAGVLSYSQRHFRQRPASWNMQYPGSLLPSCPILMSTFSPVFGLI